MVDIWAFSHDNPPSHQDLEAIANFLVASFSESVQEQVVAVEMHLTRHRSLTVSIRRPTAGNGPMDLYWEGKLLYSVGKGRIAIDAELFCFIGKDRIGSLDSQGSSYFLFNAKQATDGLNIEWIPRGMQDDEFGEWDHIVSPLWIDRWDMQVFHY